MMGTLGQMHIVVDPYMPTRRRVRFPRKGPYYQRRMKRSAKDPINWQWPEKPFVVFGGDIILCHPDYMPLLKQAISSQGVGVIIRP